MAGKTRNYTEDFKKQIVALHGNGKTSIDLSKEYSIAKSTVTKWVRDYNNNGSFKAKDNRSEEENEILALKKQLKQIEMENDILKQAALIMGRR